jgi:hypothetical protein
MANEALAGDAPEGRFVETDQSDLPCPVLFAKVKSVCAKPRGACAHSTRVIPPPLKAVIIRESG